MMNSMSLSFNSFNDLEKLEEEIALLLETLKYEKCLEAVQEVGLKPVALSEIHLSRKRSSKGQKSTENVASLRDVLNLKVEDKGSVLTHVGESWLAIITVTNISSSVVDLPMLLLNLKDKNNKAYSFSYQYDCTMIASTSPVSGLNSETHISIPNGSDSFKTSFPEKKALHLNPGCGIRFTARFEYPTADLSFHLISTILMKGNHVASYKLEPKAETLFGPMLENSLENFSLEMSVISSLNYGSIRLVYKHENLSESLENLRCFFTNHLGLTSFREECRSFDSKVLNFFTGQKCIMSGLLLKVELRERLRNSITIFTYARHKKQAQLFQSLFLSWIRKNLQQVLKEININFCNNRRSLLSIQDSLKQEINSFKLLMEDSCNRTTSLQRYYTDLLQTDIQLLKYCKLFS